MIFGVGVDATGWGRYLYQKNGKRYSQRAVERATSAALKTGILHWHSTMLPDHFTPGNAEKYNYQERSDAYKRRKQRRRRTAKGRPIVRGGRVDLVYTGDTERRAKTRFVAEAKRTTARLYMWVPRYITTRRRFAGVPDMAREITRINEQEETEINGLVGLEFYDNIDDEIQKAPRLRVGRT